MSGPIWQHNDDQKVQCDSCLQEVEQSYTEGTVVDADFVAHRHLCDTCYTENIRMINRSPSEN